MHNIPSVEKSTYLGNSQQVQRSARTKQTLNHIQGRFETLSQVKRQNFRGDKLYHLVLNLLIEIKRKFNESGIVHKIWPVHMILPCDKKSYLYIYISNSVCICIFHRVCICNCIYFCAHMTPPCEKWSQHSIFIFLLPESLWHLSFSNLIGRWWNWMQNSMNLPKVQYSVQCADDTTLWEALYPYLSPPWITPALLLPNIS